MSRWLLLILILFTVLIIIEARRGDRREERKERRQERRDRRRGRFWGRYDDDDGGDDSGSKKRRRAKTKPKKAPEKAENRDSPQNKENKNDNKETSDNAPDKPKSESDNDDGAEGGFMRKSCYTDANCPFPYAECRRGRCRCRRRTRLNRSVGMCVPRRFRCPFRRTKKRRYNHCRIDLATNTSNCGYKFFCSPLDGNPSNSDGNVTSIDGICCRLPRQVCPFGRRIRLSGGRKSCGSECTKPSVNGYCYWSPEVKIGEPVCCPKPCPQGMFFSENRCRDGG